MAATLLSATVSTAGPAATVRVCDLADHQIVQRRPDTTSAVVSVRAQATVPAAATVTAAVVRFEGGAPVTPWTALSVDKGDTAYSGILEVPQGGWYRLAARVAAPGGKILASDTGAARWAVGANILCIGQSNMVGNGSIHRYTAVTAPVCGLFGNDNAWRELADPYDNGGSPHEIDYDSWIGASMVPSMVNALAKALPGLPIGIVTAAKGGTSLCGADPDDWVARTEGDHADPGTLYGNSVANARRAGGVELVVMHQGESDATDSRSTEEYLAALRTLLAHYREDLSPTVPLFICQIGRALSTDRNRTDLTMQAIRRAQLLADNGRDIRLAAVCIDFANRDADHYDKAGYDTLGARLANAIACHFGAAAHYRGPAIASAHFSGPSRDTVLVTLSHRGGADITPAKGIIGFEVFDSAAAVPITAATRHSPTAVKLALGSPVKGSGTLRYLYGKHPDASGCVRENTALALPLEPTADPVPIEPCDARK